MHTCINALEFVVFNDHSHLLNNEASLRDLIVVTGLKLMLLKLDSNCWFFTTYDYGIRRMISKNNRAPPLFYTKLCALFQSYQWFRTVVTVQKRPIRVKIGNFLSRVTLKFTKWPLEITGHLLYGTSSFMHHSIAVGEFKLELQPRNAQFGSKYAIFLSCMILKFNRWPWKTIGHLIHASSSFVQHFAAICEYKLKLWSVNGQIGAPFIVTSVTLTSDLWPWSFAWTTTI